MELNEMEKKLLFQVEGDYQTKILNELYMTVRYSNNSEQREAAEGLMAKLRVLSNAECMDLVKDIQKNYRLPYPARTIGEKIAEARQQSGAEKLKGHQESHGQNFQKLGKDLMSVDELAVMDGGKCLLQIRGVRPFLSRKYDITKHPNYKLLSDFNEKNAFNIEKFLSTRMPMRPGERYRNYEVTAEDLASQTL
jgi:hypothetical protein